MERAETTMGIIGSGVISDDAADDLEERIAEQGDAIYRSRLVQRLLVWWACVGTLVLAGAAALCFALAPASWLLVLAVAIPVLSLLVAVRLIYRQHFVVRAAQRGLRDAHRAYQEHLLDDLAPNDVLATHKRYRAQLPDMIGEYRTESRRQRRRYNALMTLVVAGSIATAATAALSMSVADIRWLCVLVSLVVAVAAFVAAYGKYRERSMSLQVTGDALEREYRCVELRVGRYRRFSDERDAYEEFAHEVELLRDEQAKRQQQLGYPVTAAKALPERSGMA